MFDVVGIKFKTGGRIYLFSPNGESYKKGDTVIVENESGLQIGTVAEEPKTIEESTLKSPLSNVVRKATDEDIKKSNENQVDEKKAVKLCRELAEKYNLNMYIIDASFTFDRSQLFIRFMSDARVDFRKLARDLANQYKTRIELRQVGVRDKAKEIGGFGQCGRTLCCSRYMCDFDSVSINMAKNQNIALNPNKINGVCGRLLCCLKYEDECYKECRKGMPQMGKKISTEKGEGKVINVDVLKGTYKVYISDVGVVEFNRDQCK